MNQRTSPRIQRRELPPVMRGRMGYRKRNFEVFGRKLREHCQGEKLPAIGVPQIAPWWKPTFDCDSL